MLIIPTIEIQNGRCVSLTRGDLDQPQIWHVDPVEKAKEFASLGAEWMQVTDFDAVAGSGENEELILNIIRQAGIAVQVAGGIRTMEQAEAWVEKGAGQIVIGTAAVLNPDFLKQAANRFPDQIVLAIDAMEGHVLTNGWKTKSAFTPEALLAAFGDAPFSAVLFTDIDSDLLEGESSLSRVSALVMESFAPVIASGLVKTVDDISRLKYVPNIAGTIVGRALFNRSIKLEEALEVAQPVPEAVAEFT